MVLKFWDPKRQDIGIWAHFSTFLGFSVLFYQLEPKSHRFLRGLTQTVPAKCTVEDLAPRYLIQQTLTLKPHGENGLLVHPCTSDPRVLTEGRCPALWDNS